MKQFFKKLFNKNNSKWPFLDLLKAFAPYSDKYFIVIKESQENGQEITIASKEQKKKKKEES